MKNTKLSLICCAALLWSTPLMAANPIVTAVDTIADAGAGPGIEVKLSPGVNLGYTLEADGASFAINTENTNVNYDATANVVDRNEYGIASDYAGYFQRPAQAANISVPSADDSAAFGTTGEGAFTKM